MVPKINYGGWGEGAVLAHFLSGIFWRGFLSDLQNFPGFSGILSPKIRPQSSSDFKAGMGKNNICGSNNLFKHEKIACQG
jgi:hypothetical protein